MADSSASTSTTTTHGSVLAGNYDDNSSSESASPAKQPSANSTNGADQNDLLPSQSDLFKLKDAIVVDEDGKSRSFHQIYTGPNVTLRVLVVFIRHFFCGNCQEYIRTLCSSITTDSLLHLPVPASIAIIGCGAPSLIPDYRKRTNCTFPIYTDPTGRLYNGLGMLKTLSMGSRPEYQRSSALSLTAHSLFQNLKEIPVGRALEGGNMRQVGGEFLFEPCEGIVMSPDVLLAETHANEENSGYFEVEKRVVWCHRMRYTRDHVELPELREILGYENEGIGGGNERRWSKALESRKGSRLSR